AGAAQGRPSFPTRRSSDLRSVECRGGCPGRHDAGDRDAKAGSEAREGLFLSDQAGDVTASAREADSHSVAEAEGAVVPPLNFHRSEEHTSELQSRENLVCR